MTGTERGWLAGIIDGEGSVFMDRRGTWRRPGMSVSSTDLEILLELKRLVGGSIHSNKLHGKMKKPQWCWKYNGARQVLAVLKKLSPLLRCPQKKARAEILLKEYTTVTPRNGFYTPAMRVKKADFERRFYEV